MLPFFHTNHNCHNNGHHGVTDCEADNGAVNRHSNNSIHHDVINYHQVYFYDERSDFADVNYSLYHHARPVSTADVVSNAVAHRNPNGMPDYVRPRATVQHC